MVEIEGEVDEIFQFFIAARRREVREAFEKAVVEA